MLHKLSVDPRGVATVTLNRPELHNAFNDELIAELIQVFGQLERDDNVRLVVITGEGKSFCAGADLNWMKKMKDYTFEENVQDANQLAELFTVINQFSKPTICRMNGSALGGGAGLVACCDYVIAEDTAQLGFTEVRLGLVPAVISPFVMAKIGVSHARATFLSGARFGVERAMQMGLVHQVSSFDKIDEDVEALIKDFLLAGPIAQKTAKELISVVATKKDNHSARSYTTELISKVRSSAEGQEGMSALLEKRKSTWTQEKK